MLEDTEGVVRTPPRIWAIMARDEMPTWRSTRGSGRTGFPRRWTGGAELERKGYDITCYWDLVTFYGLLKSSTCRRVTRIRAVSRVPKNYMPALPAEVPRQYHTGPILSPHTRYFDVVHKKQKEPRPYTRSEQMTEQITRTSRSNTTPASRTPQNTCVPPSSTVYHVARACSRAVVQVLASGNQRERSRRVAAARSGKRSGPGGSRRCRVRALQFHRGICTGASWLAGERRNVI